MISFLFFFFLADSSRTNSLLSKSFLEFFFDTSCIQFVYIDHNHSGQNWALLGKLLISALMFATPLPHFCASTYHFDSLFTISETHFLKSVQIICFDWQWLLLCHLPQVCYVLLLLKSQRNFSWLYPWDRFGASFCSTSPIVWFSEDLLPLSLCIAVESFPYEKEAYSLNNRNEIE